MLLMKRISAFCHTQQLTIPIAFVVLFEGWQIATHQLTLDSLLKNPLNEFMPHIATLGLLLAIQIVLAARDLNREIAADATKDALMIIHPENQPRTPSKLPGRAIGTILIAFIVLGECFVIERAYPVDSINMRIPPPPKAPVLTDPKPVAKVPKPAKIYVVRFATDSYEASRPLKIRVYIDNLGDLPLSLTGASYTKLIDEIPSDYAALEKLEQGLWEEAASIPTTQHMRLDIKVMPPREFFIEVQTLEITQENLQKLTNRGSMYLIGIYKDDKGNRMGVCIRTTPARNGFLYCIDPTHNFDDVNPLSRKRGQKK